MRRRSVAAACTLTAVLCLAACGASAKPNVAVHMARGTTASECTQIARYNVLSSRKLNAGGTNTGESRHALKVSLAVIKEAADQLPTNDPVRIAALKYVARGTTYPYFEPCRRLMSLADVGELPGANR